MTYREAVEWLYASQLFGIRLGLETMRRLCEALEIQTATAPAGTRGIPVFLHVAGTNGKGSVCAMLDSILRAAGRRTGLYTSPHLVTFRERIRLNGEMIPEVDVAIGLTRIRELIESWEERPTFFEIVTALALRWFQEQRAEVTILETGLGGRLDATNVVTPAVTVLTPISLDHEKYLGATLAEIAAEKAGIIKPGVMVVSAPQADEVRKTIVKFAPEHSGFCAFVSEPYTLSAVGLPGSHQRWNAELAVNALSFGFCEYPVLDTFPDEWKLGLAGVEWPGRFQRVRGEVPGGAPALPGSDRYVLDGAHNPAAAAQLTETWGEVYGDAKATLILGVMRDKDVRGVCAALAPIAARVFTVTVNNPRSSSAAELAATMRDVARGLEVRDFPNLRAALAAAEPHIEMVLIAGSLFLVGEALVALGLADAESESSMQ